MKKEPIYLLMSDPWFKKGDIIRTSGEGQFKVVKYYKIVWWRKLLQYFGFETHMGLTKIEKLDEKN